MEESAIKCPACGTALDLGRPTCPGCGRDVASLLPTEGPTDATPAPEGVARSIGDFGILRTIGRGGMGTVYEAYQASMRRRVALKVLDSVVIPSPDETSRFEREAWIGAA